MITLSVSASRAPKVSGSIQPSVSYGLQANTFASAPAKNGQSSPQPRTVFVGVVEATKKTQVLVKLISREEFLVPSGEIFGTIFSPKSFLTATSRFFIDKTFQAISRETALGSDYATGGFLLPSGRSSWQP